MPIRFFCEEVDYKIKNPRKTANWIQSAARLEKGPIGDINFIFCSDNYLHHLNQEYLRHNTLTDIITFDYSDGGLISGDIYISIQRVTENASKFQTSFQNELHRVLIHGVLHLCGYKDKKPREVNAMRKKEEAYLSLQKSMFHVKR